MIIEKDQSIDDINVLMPSNARSFSIKDSEKAFQVLSSNLYSNPIKAIIRELSCNAIDANRMKNNNDPIILSLPCEESPVFEVTDCGIGMTEQEVYDLYSTYFASSKDNRNDQIGALGLGSKSPFSYTKSFNLISSKNGIKNTFVAAIKGNKPHIHKVSSEDCDPNISGTKVSFNVNSSDFNNFYESAFHVILGLDQIPIIKTGKTQLNSYIYDSLYQRASDEFIKDLNKVFNNNYFCDNIKSLDRNDLYYKTFNGTRLISELSYGKFSSYMNIFVNMGGILYYIDNNKFLNNIESEPDKKFYESYFNNGSKLLIIKCDLGDVSISPNRETLYYDEKTINYIVSNISNNITKKIDEDLDKLSKVSLYKKYIFKDMYAKILSNKKSDLYNNLSDNSKDMVDSLFEISKNFNLYSKDNFMVGIIENNYGEYNPKCIVLNSDKINSKDIINSNELVLFISMNEYEYNKYKTRLKDSKDGSAKINRYNSSKFEDKILELSNKYKDSEGLDYYNPNRYRFFIFKESDSLNIDILNEFYDSKDIITFNDYKLDKKTREKLVKEVSEDNVKVYGKSKLISLESMLDLTDEYDKVYYYLYSASNNYLYDSSVELKMSNLKKLDQSNLSQLFAKLMPNINTKDFAIVGIPFWDFKNNNIMNEENFIDLSELIKSNFDLSIKDAENKLSAFKSMNKRNSIAEKIDRKEFIAYMATNFLDANEKSEYFKYINNYSSINILENSYNSSRNILDNLYYTIRELNITHLISTKYKEFSDKCSQINKSYSDDNSLLDNYPMLKIIYELSYRSIENNQIPAICNYIADIENLTRK